MRDGGAVRGWRALTVTGEATGHGPVPLRPLTLSDLLDEPFVLLRENLRAILLVTGAVVVPVQLLASFLQRDVFGGFGLAQMFSDPTAAQVALESGDAGSLGPIAVTVIAAITAQPIVSGLVTRIAVSSLLGEKLDAGAALRATLRQWPTLIGAALLTAIATYGLAILGFAAAATGQTVLVVVGIGVLLAALPVGVALHALLIATSAAVVVEGLRPVAALRRSFRLVRPRFFPVLGALLLAALVGGLVQSALSGIPSAAAFVIGMESAWLLLAVGAIAAGLVVTPYTALVASLVYVDGQVRREGLDIAVLADGR